MQTRAQRNRERLEERLRALGVVPIDEIGVPRGFWSHQHQDVLRWTVQATVPGRFGIHSVGSWDSVGECVRRDRRLVLTGPGTSVSGGYEVHALPLGQQR